jgi:hypothetical protein
MAASMLGTPNSDGRTGMDNRMSALAKRIIEEAERLRDGAEPKSARQVVAATMPVLVDLRARGYSWKEITASIQKAEVRRPDGQAFTVELLRRSFISLGGAAQVDQATGREPQP